MNDLHAVLSAISFAARTHQGQLRKDKMTPYAAHVFRVCLIVRQVFGLDDPRILSAAVLHDTIEDTNTDFDDLAKEFGEEVADWVSRLTKDKKLREAEREEEYLARLNASPWQVKACKLADLLDNLIDSAHLSGDEKAKALSRYRHYWSAFRGWPEPELRKPLEIVGAAVERMAD